MAYFNEAYTLDTLRNLNDPMRSIDEFYEQQNRYIDEMFNECNFSCAINEAEGKTSFGDKIKELVNKAIATIKRIWEWIKNKVKEVKGKIKEFIDKIRHKKKDTGVKILPSGDAKLLPQGDIDANESKKPKNDENKGTVVTPEAKKAPELEEPVDLNEIVELMEKDNNGPKINFFAWRPCASSILSRYLMYITGKVEEDIDGRDYSSLDEFIDQYEERKQDVTGKIPNWDDRTYYVMAGSMLELIRKRYFNDTITNKKRRFTNDGVVDPEDDKYYDKVFNDVERQLTELTENSNERIANYSVKAIQMLSKAYNDVARYQAENLQAYYKFIDLMPVYADKVRAERRKENKEEK